MPDFGVRVAKRGHGYEDADRYMIWNTKYPKLKLFASAEGNLNTTAGGGGATAQITHSLGYKPFVFVSGKWIASGFTAVGSKYADWNRYVPQGVQEVDLYYHYSDTTKLYIV